jgi:hypothetical protein
MKIWTCGSSARSRSRNAWTRIKNVNGTSRPSNFWNFSARSKWFPVGRDWWPWTKSGYIAMTRRQSNNQWTGGIAVHPAPKNSECNNPLESSRLDFLGSRRHPFQWLSSKGPNCQRGVLLISADVIEGYFEGKTPRGGKVTKGVLFLHDNSPAHQSLATQQKLAYLCFQYLDHQPYSPDLAPSDYHLFPGLKKQLKCRHFFPTRRPGWTENIMIFFFIGLQMLEQRTKKCIELRGEYVE